MACRPSSAWDHLAGLRFGYLDRFLSVLLIRKLRPICHKPNLKLDGSLNGLTWNSQNGLKPSSRLGRFKLHLDRCVSVWTAPNILISFGRPRGHSMRSKTQSLRPQSTIGGVYLQRNGADSSSAWTEEKTHCVWRDSSIQAEFQDMPDGSMSRPCLSRGRSLLDTCYKKDSP